MKKIKKKVGKQYLHSNVKWLRKGDEFRMYFGDKSHVDLEAHSDPYYDNRANEWVVDIKNPEYEDISA